MVGGVLERGREGKRVGKEGMGEREEGKEVLILCEAKKKHKNNNSTTRQSDKIGSTRAL